MLRGQKCIRLARGDFNARVCPCILQREDIIQRNPHMPLADKSHTAVAEEHILPSTAVVSAVASEQFVIRVDAESVGEAVREVFLFKDRVDICDYDLSATHSSRRFSARYSQAIGNKAPVGKVVEHLYGGRRYLKCIPVFSARADELVGIDVVILYEKPHSPRV